MKKLLKAFSVFDIEQISIHIPEDAEFEEYPNKYCFLAEYKLLFEEIENSQLSLNFPLMAVNGNCHYCLFKYTCENKKMVYCFAENDLIYNKLFSMIFEINADGHLAEMYRCYNAFHSTLVMHQKPDEPEDKYYEMNSNPIISFSMSFE